MSSGSEIDALAARANAVMADLAAKVQFTLIPDMSYQKGGEREFPAWVPGEALPSEVAEIVLQLTTATRGPDRATDDLRDLFSDEEAEIAAALRWLPLASREVPF